MFDLSACSTLKPHALRPPLTSSVFLPLQEQHASTDSQNAKNNIVSRPNSSGTLVAVAVTVVVVVVGSGDGVVSFTHA